MKRTAARKTIKILNSGYGEYGGSHIKKSLKGWIYRGGSAKEDIIDHLPTLRQRSRDLFMGVPIATGAIKTMRTNIVGWGLKLKSQVDYKTLKLNEDEARVLKETIEREFSLWADSSACDIERLDNFYELQQLAFMNWLLSGDVIVTLPVTKRVNMPYDLRINLIEADRLSTPTEKLFDKNIIDGVEINSDGEVVAYHISKTHPLSTDEIETKWTRIEAWGKQTGRRNVLHIMNRERIGQLRGTPFLSPVIEALKQLGRYTDAELTAAVVAGFFSVFIEKESASSELPIGEVIPKEQQVDAGDGNSIELAPGAIIDLNPGEKATAQNPGRPNGGFDAFIIAMCRQVGTALEIPYEILVKHFTSSFSASRGALLEFWKSVRMYRTWLASDFCQPIYEEFFAEAVAKGRINAPGFFSDPIIRKAYLGAEWNGPAQGLLNPVQEVNAAAKRVQEGFSTHEREAQEMNGSDFYQNAAQLRREQILMNEVQKNAEKQ